MKKWSILFVLTCSLLLSCSVAFAGAQDFTLVNNTGQPISELYVSPASSNDWQEDVLGVDVLGDGENLHITFNNGDRATHWDLKAVLANGASLVYSDFNLKQISIITLKRNGDASYQ